MLRVALPDPLVWQAGLEWGLEALSDARRQGLSFSCQIGDEGPLLEAVAFSVKEMALSNVSFVNRKTILTRRQDVYLFPRVKAMEQESVLGLVRRGAVVLTSDPEISAVAGSLRLFHRRDVGAVVTILQRLGTT
jgi:hypothetical protein